MSLLTRKSALLITFVMLFISTVYTEETVADEDSKMITVSISCGIDLVNSRFKYELVGSKGVSEVQLKLMAGHKLISQQALMLEMPIEEIAHAIIKEVSALSISLIDGKSEVGREEKLGLLVEINKGGDLARTLIGIGGSNARLLGEIREKSVVLKRLLIAASINQPKSYRIQVDDKVIGESFFPGTIKE